MKTPATPAVNIHNWKTHTEFREFLGLTYKPSDTVARHCVELLPAAVDEDRLIGAIKMSILSEAMNIFNQPRQNHYFRYSTNLRKWTYKGTQPKGLVTHIFEGRLNRVVPAGRFCPPPLEVLMRGAELLMPQDPPNIEKLLTD